MTKKNTGHQKANKGTGADGQRFGFADFPVNGFLAKPGRLNRKIKRSWARGRR